MSWLSPFVLQFFFTAMALSYARMVRKEKENN
jgi:hypothetical protein